jgi:hypothetical protein
VRSDVVLIWGLFCVCYWLYPLWSRGNISWDLKFAVLTAYTVGFLVLLRWWNRHGRDTAESPPRDSAWTDFSTPWGLASIGVLLVAAVLEFRETFLPILSGPDEPYRITAALEQWQAITAADAGVVKTALALASPILLGLAGLILLSQLRPTVARVAAGGGLLVVGLALNHEMMLAVGTRWGGSPRWPPLGTLVEVLSFSAFGLGEASARLPALLFFMLTGVVLFRMVAHETTPLVAFIAVVSVLSSPAFFTQGQLASRETAGAFFMTAAAYFLMRRWRFGRGHDLGWSIAMTLAAYLTRRPTMAFSAVIIAVEAARIWQRRRSGSLHEIRSAVVPLLLGLGVLGAGAFPWMFSTRTIRPFELSPPNWLDWQLVVAYPSQFPAAMGLVVTVLGTVGVVIAVVHRRILTSLALLWLAVVYALFTSDIPRWIPTWRFLALMCPAWAVLAAAGFRFLHDRLPTWARTALAAIVVVGVAASVVMWSWCGLSPSWFSSAPCRGEVPRYPFAQVVSWVEENEAKAVVMTPATYWQTSLDVYAIFQGSDRVDEYLPPYGSPAPPLNLRDMRGVCRTEPVDFVVVPYRRKAGQWIPNFMEPEEAGRLASEFGSGEVAIFTQGSHRLEVYPCPID